MPKAHPKNRPKNLAAKNKLKPKPEQVSLTKSKFYWLSLTVVTVVGVLAFGFLTGITPPKIALILVTALSIIGVAGYARLKSSALTFRTRVTYIFVGAAVIGYGTWAVAVLSLAATEVGIQVANVLGDQLFIMASQIVFIAMGAFIGEWLSTNMAFQAFALKIKQKF